MDVPAAVRLELLKFLPKHDLPGRLRKAPGGKLSRPSSRLPTGPRNSEA